MSDKRTGEEDYSDWIGKAELNSDSIDARQARLMQTITGADEAGAKKEFAHGVELPALWHWLYFPTTVPLDELGQDGHPKLGGFLPPIELPRRMWAGGRLAFFHPLKIGDQVEKKSTIKSIKLKNGRSGKLCFVTVLHEFSNCDNLCISEEHDIVYRENSVPGTEPATEPVTPPAAPTKWEWKREISPDPVLLFRYSALTFNGHRIHYDRDYCRQVEGLKGLLVHGPLTATLLVDLAVKNNPGRTLQRFNFRAISPLFDTENFVVAGENQGKNSEVWAQNFEGKLAMKAEAIFR